MPGAEGHLGRPSAAAGRPARRGIWLQIPIELCDLVSTAVARGFVPGPRILASGGGIAMTGGHAWGMGFVEADGADEVRRVTRQQLKAGADVIKLVADQSPHLVAFTGDMIDLECDGAQPLFDAMAAIDAPRWLPLRSMHRSAGIICASKDIENQRPVAYHFERME